MPVPKIHLIADSVCSGSDDSRLALAAEPPPLAQAEARWISPLGTEMTPEVGPRQNPEQLPRNCRARGLLHHPVP
jgi:hypothetical protein